eukprot:6461816-Amphidinium_carterae.1
MHSALQIQATIVRLNAHRVLEVRTCLHVRKRSSFGSPGMECCSYVQIAGHDSVFTIAASWRRTFSTLATSTAKEPPA